MPLFFSPAYAKDTGSAFDFSFMGIDGQILPLSDFDGKVMLVVNTASNCGFTRQYADLQALYDKYRDRGLIVLGVPSNDFGGQELGSDAEIRQFCETKFNIDFPMAGKSVVTGTQAHPFYQWAANQVTALGRPRWNFHKFLIGPNGRLIDWFSSMTSPRDDKVIAAIERLLPQEALSPAVA